MIEYSGGLTTSVGAGLEATDRAVKVSFQTTYLVRFMYYETIYLTKYMVSDIINI